MSETMREFWKAFGHKFTAGSSTIHTSGTTRPMTAEEERLFDRAMLSMDNTFDKISDVFAEAERENERRGRFK